MSRREGSGVPANAPVLTAQRDASGGMATVMDPIWVAFLQGLVGRGGAVGDLIETLPAVAERAGCLPCDGGRYRQAEYPDLYALLGPASAGPDATFSAPLLPPRTGADGTVEARVWVRAR